MKKAVLLAPYFLPRRRVGSWRPFKFAIHLKKYGWEPHVFTIRETRNTLTAKEKAFLSDIAVHEIKSPFDFTHRLNNGYAYSGFSNKKNASGPSPKFTPAKSIINWIDKQIPIDSWLPLFIYRKRYLEKLMAKINPDILWSTGDPWSSHWMGKELTNNLDIPWIADFRDPWTLGNVNLKNRSGFSFSMDKKEEEKVLKNASMLTFNARKTEELYQKKYRDYDIKSSTIYNCFDSSLFDDKNSAESLFDEEFLNLVFFGKFRPLSPAAPFLELLEWLYKYNAEAASKVRMYCFGSLSKEEELYARKKNLFKNFIPLKQIPLEEALPILSRADILWLSTHPSRKYIVPSKLWDYLAAKRPILSVAPNSEISKILKKTGAGVQLSSDPSSIAKLIIDCMAAKERKHSMPIPVKFDHQVIKQYDAPVATKKLANIFDGLI
ncbi:MAG TPA: hypothetical protein VK106_06305 [Balneolaceae bacterium]|nr:hypothetical protein [Balneolaceae bacterium]